MQNKVNVSVSFVLTGSDGSKMSDAIVNWSDVPYEAAIELEAKLVDFLQATVEFGREQAKRMK